MAVKPAGTCARRRQGLRPNAHEAQIEKCKHCFNASTDIDSNNFNAQSVAWGATWNGLPGQEERGFAAFKIREGSVQSDPGYYGWIDISWSNDGTLTIHGYAYNDVLDGSIHVGDVPAPGALGLIGLAAGASGIRRKRHTA